MAYSKNPHLPKVRQQAVKLVYSGWSQRQTEQYFGLSAGTLSKWLKKDAWQGRIPIPTLSSRPNSCPHALSAETVQAICRIRSKRGRCAEVVHQELLREGYTASLPSVQRTLDRQGLLRKRSPWKRWHFTLPRPEAQQPGSLVQIDTIHIALRRLHVFPKFYVYTLLDVFTRWAWARVSARANTHHSLVFLRQAQKLAPFPFEMLQSDHGSEFSSWFTEHAKLSHRHSRVR